MLKKKKKGFIQLKKFLNHDTQSHFFKFGWISTETLYPPSPKKF